jgi:uncharacterized phage protein (TIGR01671 family)
LQTHTEREQIKHGKILSRQNGIPARAPGEAEQCGSDEEEGETMREIKFRAWARRENKMIGWEDTVKFWADLGMDLSDFTQSDDFPFVYMQFTGLLDKNGKEIYEGDIVTASVYVDESEGPYEVEWLEGMFKIDYRDAEADYYPIGTFPGTIEVIGNIYESPELLKSHTVTMP